MVIFRGHDHEMSIFIVEMYHIVEMIIHKIQIVLEEVDQQT
jgi:hypothetical protein